MEDWLAIVFLLVGGVAGYTLCLVGQRSERVAAFDRGMEEGLDIGREQQKRLYLNSFPVSRKLRSGERITRQVSPDNVVVGTAPMPCRPGQYGDRLVCLLCYTEWDTNDPNPPMCGLRNIAN